MKTYEDILNDAIAMMEMYADLEPTSALKQCANDAGIEYGDAMQKFVDWAYLRLFDGNRN